jgi:pimeloyl-ACP methyl ester carboxylesterase
MLEPTLNYVLCPDATGTHRMAYWQWGEPDAGHVVLCVHGLSRQGRDFDVLARALLARSSTNLCVVCPDVAGRGQSQWLKDATAYQVPTYAADMVALIRQLAPARLDWVGTSMGGLIGLGLLPHAQGLQPTRVGRLVLNDVGPRIQWQALQRIAQYLGRGDTFSSLTEAAAALWEISSSFGPHTPAQWLDLCTPMVQPDASSPGRLRLHYDPAIALPVRAMTQAAAEQGESLLWQAYDSLKMPTLLLRGMQSDLLSPETAQEMTQRGPRARLMEFEGVGHAPTLIAPDQLAAVTDFLLAPLPG